MAIADRKRRAFEARENLVIEHADVLLGEQGYLGLNLDELADRVEYSKATLYHHFVSKEDLVLAVVDRHFEIRRDYFERACNFDGLTRERICGFGIADRLLSMQYPHGFPLVQLVRQPSIWAKCSDARKEAYRSVGGHCFDLAMKVATDAIQQGELSETTKPDQVIWGLVSLSKGAHLITEEAMFEELEDVSSEPLQYLFDNYHHFLDGTGWKPLLPDHDYDAAHERIRNELFAEEFASLSAA
ncbi:MAG: TetR/AcrR family transcriptional regulator [Verrucomicrobiota bacterium]